MQRRPAPHLARVHAHCLTGAPSPGLICQRLCRFLPAVLKDIPRKDAPLEKHVFPGSANRLPLEQPVSSANGPSTLLKPEPGVPFTVSAALAPAASHQACRTPPWKPLVRVTTWRPCSRPSAQPHDSAEAYACLASLHGGSPLALCLKHAPCPSPPLSLLPQPTPPPVEPSWTIHLQGPPHPPVGSGRTVTVLFILYAPCTKYS